MAAGTGDPSRRPHSGAASHVAYVDADGQATSDPAAAVLGEIVEYDDHGEPRRRTRFFLAERDLPWLPVSEPAFLLWVLVLFMVVWIAIGIFLALT
jgi:hypothetical protein